jgi:phosphopantetheine adenylyltransferase
MNEPKRVLKTEELIQKRAMDVKETRELLSLSEKINAALLVNRLRKCKDLSLELRKRVLDNKVNRAVQLRSKYLKSSRHLRSV